MLALNVFTAHFAKFQPPMLELLGVAVVGVNDLLFATHPELARVDDQLVKFGKYHLPNLMAGSPAHFADTAATAREDMKLFKSQENMLDDSTATMAFMRGKYSYPNGWGPDKVRKDV